MPTSDPAFAQLVSLACHDLRTPLATIFGFARTLAQRGNVDEREGKYLELIDAAAGQMAELLDDLGLVARIESGRHEPMLVEFDTLALAQAAAGRVTEGAVHVQGTGAPATLDPEPVERALAALARAALRHGGLTSVELVVDGTALTIAPVQPGVGPILLGDDLRDLGAAVARRVLEALGASAEAAAERFVVRFPR